MSFRPIRQFLLCALFLIPFLPVQASWLDTVTSPPLSLPAGIKLIPQSLLTVGARPVSAAEWPEQRSKIRQEWDKILGPLPSTPSGGLKWKVISDESLSTCSRVIIEYEAEPGRNVRACIVRPVGDLHTTRPGIVAFHPTHKDNFKVLVGLGGRPEQSLALQLVEKGFVVICPANYIYDEDTWLKSVDAARKRHPQSTGMATMVADGMRAVDILVQLPDVDTQRIGALGHSLGAKEVLYAMAFDDRIKVGVSSEGGVGIHFSNYADSWYLGPQVKEPNFHHDHHELIALIAPRPLLVFGGETGRAADGDRSWPYLIFGNSINAMLGKPGSFGLVNHQMDHKFLPPYTDMAIEWLVHYLHPPAP